MDAYTQSLLEFRCPRWNELPEIELYMDQVLGVLEKRLALFRDGETKLITSMMINNYVKQKQIPPPQAKKYSRGQLARLFVICLLKRSFSMAEIVDMTALVLDRFAREEAYDLFCEELERTLRLVFLGEAEDRGEEGMEKAMMRAVLKAFAYKLYAQHVVQACREAEEDGEA